MPIISPGGGGGGGTLVFSRVLTGNTQTIDTGAAGIPAGSNILTIAMLLRTDGAGATDNPTFTFNNDGGGNYDRLVTANANTTVSGAIALAGTSIVATCHGNGGAASYASSIVIRIPGYANTTFFKSGDMVEAVLDSTAANTAVRLTGITYKSATAISRFAIAAPGNFLTGSSVFVYVQ